MEKKGGFWMLTCSTLLALGSLKLASLAIFSWIVGSQMAFFSGTSVVMPLVGAFGGVTTSILACLLRLCTSIHRTSFGFELLAYHVPGLCAALCWRSTSLVLHVILPLVCFTLFVLHPVGGQVIPYACYWFIPVFLYGLSRSSSSVFGKALGSTFVAHAVGSVMWLYTVPLSPATWYALIPVVAVERLCCAASMVVLYGLVVQVKKWAILGCRIVITRPWAMKLEQSW